MVKCAENVSHQLSPDGGSLSDGETFLPYMVNKAALVQTDNSTLIFI